MNIGIIIYSQTNNTFSVGERLREALQIKGRTVSLERVTVVGNTKAANQFVLSEKPDVSAYDYIIFGAPVQAFGLTPVMKAYMTQLSSLNGKKIACFTTQYLKKQWLGGNQANKKMTRFVTGLGGSIQHIGIVNWSGNEREEQIRKILEDFCKI